MLPQSDLVRSRYLSSKKIRQAYAAQFPPASMSLSPRARSTISPEPLQLAPNAVARSLDDRM